MKVCIAQINPIISHFDFNAQKVFDGIEYSVKNGCDLLVFPELSLFGYWPSDLLEQRYLVEKQLKVIAKIQKKIPPHFGILVGAVTMNPNVRGPRYLNTAVFLEKNKKPQFFYKELLPNYDVFDEKRHFDSGKSSENILSFKRKKILVTICEDIWGWGAAGNIHSQNPLQKWSKKIDLVINMSASPYSLKKRKDREFVVQKTAQKVKAPMVYVNQVGGQDEIIFDGGSFAVDSKGKKILQAPFFKEEFLSLDLSTSRSTKFSIPKEVEALKQALVLGIKDYVHKNNFKKIHLGLSGGIDSALVACLAVEAVGSKNVTCIALPGPYSSQLSFDLALKLTENLKVEFINSDINAIYKAFFEELEMSFGIREFGLTHENLQSRLRGVTLMAYSNFKNSLLLTTGNKSEYAMGYSTLYGDMCGGLAPIGDLLKRQVVQLCQFINHKNEIIPEGIISRSPTAELRENQKDEDSLPAYSILDTLVENFIVKNKKPKNDFEREVHRKIHLAEFKRRQAAPILRVSERAFGAGRRYPISKSI